MEEPSNGQRGEPNAPFGVSIYHRLEFTFMNFFFFFFFEYIDLGCVWLRWNWNFFWEK